MLWERLWIAHSLPSLPRALRFHPIQNAETLWQTLLKACVLTLNRLVLVVLSFVEKSNWILLRLSPR